MTDDAIDRTVVSAGSTARALSHNSLWHNWMYEMQSTHTNLQQALGEGYCSSCQQLGYTRVVVWNFPGPAWGSGMGLGVAQVQVSGGGQPVAQWYLC